MINLKAKTLNFTLAKISTDTIYIVRFFKFTYT